MFTDYRPQARRLFHAPPGTWPRIAAVALALAVFFGAINAAAAATPARKTQQREDLRLPPEHIMEPWTGDLDGMIKP